METLLILAAFVAVPMAAVIVGAMLTARGNPRLTLAKRIRASERSAWFRSLR